MDYFIWLVIYNVFVVAHTMLFFLFISGLINIIISKYSPYWSIFIGGYLLIHSLYGGCPLLEIENYLSSIVGGPIKNIGDIYVNFDSFGLLVRVVFFICSLILLRNSYITWHEGVIQVDWSRIFRKDTRLRIAL